MRYSSRADQSPPLCARCGSGVGLARRDDAPSRLEFDPLQRLHAGTPTFGGPCCSHACRSGCSVAAVMVSDARRRMTASAFQPPDSQRSICMRIPGGDDAPTRARRSVQAQLAGSIPVSTAADAALLVTELVTNSVVHANVGPRGALSVDVTMLDDRLRIAVTDPGSSLRPRMLPRDPDAPGGRGLWLVDELCEAWGVWQDLGPTCVWCELLLNRAPASAGGHAGGKPFGH